MSVRRAMAQTLVSRQCKLVLQAVRIIVLARLLMPEDFGLFALALTIAAVAGALIDFGLSALLIRSRECPRSLVASAVGLTLTLSVVVALAFAGALVFLPPWIWPAGLPLVLGVLVLSLLVKPVMMPVTTALQREIRFGLLSVLTVIRMAVQTAVAAGFALAGFGAVSLALGVLAELLVAVVVLVVVAGRGRLAWPSFRGWRPLLGFGSRFATIDFIGKVGDMLVAISLSRVLGVAALGQFNRARTVVDLFNSSILDGIAPVVLPALSKSLRNGRDPAALYITVIGHLAALCWPAFALIAIAAEPLVLLLLGPNWLETVPAVRCLALIGLFLPFSKMSFKWFISLGIENRYLPLQLTYQLSKIALAVGGAFISLEAACLGIALAVGVKAALVTPTLQRTIGYRNRDLGLTLARCFAITALTLLGPVVVLVAAPPLAGWVELGLMLGLAGVGWLAGVVLTRHALLGEVMKLLRATPFVKSRLLPPAAS